MVSMKIGILTFHYAHNYGAVLQAYSLKEYLRNLGHDVTIVHYKNKYVAENYKKKLRMRHSFWYFLRNRAPIGYLRQILDWLYKKGSWATQYKKFEAFINTYLLEGNAIEENKNDLSGDRFDLIISGSDQLWNKAITHGYDDVYFLNFESDARKAFYAISNGGDEIGADEISYYREVLKGIKYISTREEKLAEEINTKLMKSAIKVADPSFLLKKDEYIEKFQLKKSRKTLFAYYIVEDDFMSQVVEVVAGALNLEIVELHYYKKRALNKEYQYADFGPKDFLEEINNAEFVITNSFHGLAFSLIFQKQFYGVYNKDVRKDSLLSDFGLECRHIYRSSDIDLNKRIDYSGVELEPYLENSKHFLSEITNV